MISFGTKSKIVGGDSSFRTFRFGLIIFLVRTLPLAALSFAATQMSVQDAYHRFMQPIYNMSRRPCLAKDSLLLDYLTKSPFAVSAQASKNRHWKVLIYSLLGSAPEFLLLIPYGLVTLISTEDATISEFSISAVSGTCFLVLLWLAMLLSSWPTERRRTPRPSMSLFDIWVLFHKSHVASEACFSVCEPYWTKQHLHGRIINHTHQYLMGKCNGDDDKIRIGVDICRWGPWDETTWAESAVPEPMHFWNNKRAVDDSGETGDLGGVLNPHMPEAVADDEEVQ